MNQQASPLIPIVLSITSATIVFLYSLLQKRIDFRKKRRSTLIAIYIEILNAQQGVKGLYINWDNFKEQIKDEDFKPLLVVSSDLNVLNRSKYEELNLSIALVSSLTDFLSSINAFYECLEAINSTRFCEIKEEGRLRIVEMTLSIGLKVDKQADIAINQMKQTLPKNWFILKGNSVIETAINGEINQAPLNWGFPLMRSVNAPIQ